MNQICGSSLLKGIGIVSIFFAYLSLNKGSSWSPNIGVTNAGIITGALAIYNEDPTGIAAKLLKLAIPNAQQHCAQAVHSDGTWTETPDYW